jgi:hypothetical protein
MDSGYRVWCGSSQFGAGDTPGGEGECTQVWPIIAISLRRHYLYTEFYFIENTLSPEEDKNIHSFFIDTLIYYWFVCSVSHTYVILIHKFLVSSFLILSIIWCLSFPSLPFCRCRRDWLLFDPCPSTVSLADIIFTCSSLFPQLILVSDSWPRF